MLPCGIQSQGGIGQAIRNLLGVWQSWPDAPALKVVDTWHVQWKTQRPLISPIYFIAAVIHIIGARLTGRLHLLHLNMAPRGSSIRKGILTWLGSLLRIPVLVHIHASSISEQFNDRPAWLRALFRKTLDRATYVVTLGQFWQSYLIDEIGVDPDKVVIVPYGVPDPRFARQPRDSKPLRLLFLGQLGERKGTPVLLRALAMPSLRSGDWSLVLAGDGEVEEMRKLAVELGISERCTFTGWVDRMDAERLLSNSDIFVLPSRAEGLPVAILEAMSYGLAIVTTPVGAIAEAITDRETGLLIPPEDDTALANALVELLEQQDLRRRIGKGAKDKFHKEFTLQRYAESIREIYRRCGLT